MQSLTAASALHINNSSGGLFKLSLPEVRLRVTDLERKRIYYSRSNKQNIVHDIDQKLRPAKQRLAELEKQERTKRALEHLGVKPGVPGISRDYPGTSPQKGKIDIEPVIRLFDNPQPFTLSKGPRLQEKMADRPMFRGRSLGLRLKQALLRLQWSTSTEE